jgi:uncharacterized damage-inducible protein DinB
MNAKTPLVSLFKFKAWSNAELFGTLAMLNAEQCATERHTAIRLMNHIHTVDEIFVANLQAKPHAFTATNTAETPSLEALTNAAKTTDDWYINFVTNVNTEALNRPIEFTFTDGSLARMTVEEMLMHIITHGAYHRGAVGRIISQIGTPPPRDLYTRFLHELEPGRRVRA